MVADTRRADAEHLASKCEELERLARYSGFDFAAYLLSVVQEELVKQQHLSSKRSAESG